MDRIHRSLLATALIFLVPACSEESDARVGLLEFREDAYLLKRSTTSFTDDDHDGEWTLHILFESVNCDPSEDRKDIAFWFDAVIPDVSAITVERYVGAEPSAPKLKASAWLTVEGCTYTGEIFGFVWFEALSTTDSPPLAEGYVEMAISGAKPECSGLDHDTFLGIRRGYFSSLRTLNVCPAE